MSPLHWQAGSLPLAPHWFWLQITSRGRGELLGIANLEVKDGREKARGKVKVKAVKKTLQLRCTCLNKENNLKKKQRDNSSYHTFN